MADEADTTTEQTDTEATTTDADTAGTSAQTTDEDAKVTDDDGNVDWKAAARRNESRSKSAKARADAAETKAQEAEARLQAVLKAAGIDTDEKVDPDQLAKDLADRTAGEQSARVELAIYKAASKAGADADSLTDSRSFMSEVAKLDVNADDFGTQLSAAIKAHAKAHPATKVTAGTSGGEVNGNRPSKPLTEQLADAQKAGNIQLAIAIKQRMAAGQK